MTDEVWDWITSICAALLLLGLAGALGTAIFALAMQVHPATLLLLPVWAALAVYIKRGM